MLPNWQKQTMKLSRKSFEILSNEEPKPQLVVIFVIAALLDFTMLERSSSKQKLAFVATITFSIHLVFPSN